jgi:RNA-directed DNA polymerase
MNEPKPKGKPFVISKWVVWEAYQRVKANDGAAGVDEQSIEEFERDLKGNLDKLWNRLSSGSYFPSPVRAVEIPKKHGHRVGVDQSGQLIKFGGPGTDLRFMDGEYVTADGTHH